jgi:universal stress protein A
MNAFQNVLVGLDLSGLNARAILARACQIADSDDIEVVHICDHLHKRHQDYGASAFANSEELDKRIIADAHSRLEDMCRNFGITHHKVLGGKTAAAMHDYAREHADLVVIGSHGRHGAQTVFGSTSNAVVHGTPCDVLAVHISDDPGKQPASYQHILVAVNLKAESTRVVEHALQIAEASGAALSACHAYSGFGIDAQTQERRELEALGSRHGIDPDALHVMAGSTADGVHDLARTIGADLIVVGTHGRHGLQLIKGSTANAVLHGVQCDALSVRVA